MGDFNGDGKLDLVTSSGLDRTVSVLLGNGDGTFQNARKFAVGAQPDDGPNVVAVGDLNGDGKQDLVVAARPSNNVTVLLGNGDGSFGAATHIAVGGGPEAVAVGDFNGDGKLDLVIANFDSSSVSVLLGKGDGTFGPPKTFAAGGGVSIVLSDFNRDGKLDIAVGNRPTNTISVLLGNGDGTFQPAKTLALGGSIFPVPVVVGDWNHDGNPDLATAGDGQGISVLLGKGDGSFEPAKVFSEGLVSGVTGMAATDLNADGNQDLVVVNYTEGTVSVVLGLGDGNFQTAITSRGCPTPTGVVAGNLESDHFADVAVRCYSSVAVLRGTGNGRFDSPPIVHLAAFQNTFVVGDFNGDGNSDLVVQEERKTAPYPKSLWMIAGNGNGTFQPPKQFFVATGILSLSVVGVGDFNRDGNLDLVVITQNPPLTTVSVFLGDGHGGFREISGPNLNFFGGVAVGDFNNDGKLDLAFIDSAKGGSIYLGRGDGTFRHPISWVNDKAVFSLVAGDFNNDGKLDLATANTNDNTVSVLLGNGNGTFQKAIHSATGAYPTSLASGNFNNDGKLDLVTTNCGSQDMSVLIGNGNGKFKPPVSVGAEVIGCFSEVVVGDFNHDGKADLAAGADGALIYLFPGTGYGSFVAGPIYSAPGALGAADFNNDSKMDLVVSTQRSFLLLLNTTP